MADLVLVNKEELAASIPLLCTNTGSWWKEVVLSASLRFWRENLRDLGGRMSLL